ncbi:MFS transporter [Gandjariella thermophila]|uniref:MFS transporter n=1 Tax=Gandjariella thermophila TaxID=1931992 RepID=A0A4D4J1L7_9PSEU|nr:MFS transporter [Gandjariella thermophila]GDY28529.1 MFS transporter [Gandjariella thermophila]
MTRAVLRSSDALAAHGEDRLTRNQRLLVAAALVGNTIEFYDYFVIGFVVTLIVTPWRLTFGQTSVVLLASGIGVVLGAAVWGHVADRIGRRACVVVTMLTFSLATGAMAAVPERAWALLAALRVVVGFGVGGLPVVNIPLVQEFVPARRRAVVTGLTVVFIPVGLLLGAVLSAWLGPVIGWRGLLLIGLAPALPALLIGPVIPESPRWLAQRGRAEEARRSLAWALQVPVARVRLPDGWLTRSPVGWRALLRHPRALAVAGVGTFCFLTAASSVQSWGPTLLSQVLGVSPASAAALFAWLGLVSVAGRLAWSRLAEVLGRRAVVSLCGFAGAGLVAATAVRTGAFLGPVSVFLLGFAVAYFFLDGVFGVINTYTAEMFRTGSRAGGLGLCYGFGSLGKIVGPLLLGLVSGGGNYVTPRLTQAAVTPTFLILAGLLLLAGVGYLFGRETRGRALDEPVRPAENG